VALVRIVVDALNAIIAIALIMIAKVAVTSSGVV
jgi:hypothetical protein